jgi:hypothetical protein
MTTFEFHKQILIREGEVISLLSFDPETSKLETIQKIEKSLPTNDISSQKSVDCWTSEWFVSPDCLHLLEMHHFAKTSNLWTHSATVYEYDAKIGMYLRADVLENCPSTPLVGNLFILFRNTYVHSCSTKSCLYSFLTRERVSVRRNLEENPIWISDSYLGVISWNKIKLYTTSDVLETYIEFFCDISGQLELRTVSKTEFCVTDGTKSQICRILESDSGTLKVSKIKNLKGMCFPLSEQLILCIEEKRNGRKKKQKYARLWCSRGDRWLLREHIHLNKSCFFDGGVVTYKKDEKLVSKWSSFGSFRPPRFPSAGVELNSGTYAMTAHAPDFFNYRELVGRVVNLPEKCQVLGKLPHRKEETLHIQRALLERSELVNDTAGVVVGFLN